MKFNFKRNWILKDEIKKIKKWSKKHKSSAETSHLDLEMGIMWLKRKSKKKDNVIKKKIKEK